MSIRTIIALSATIVLSTAATASAATKKQKVPRSGPQGSRHRAARRPTFRSLQSHETLPSRSHRRW
jgi:hypothetical protein